MSVLCEDELDWASLLTQRKGTSPLFDTIAGMGHLTRDPLFGFCSDCIRWQTATGSLEWSIAVRLRKFLRLQQNPGICNFSGIEIGGGGGGLSVQVSLGIM